MFKSLQNSLESKDSSSKALDLRFEIVKIVRRLTNIVYKVADILAALQDLAGDPDERDSRCSKTELVCHD
jgi:hypothetical protein